MSGKLTLRPLPRTDDGKPLQDGPVWRWAVDGVPGDGHVEIAEFHGKWRVLRVWHGSLKSDPQEFPTAEAAFASLVEEYVGRV